MSFQINELYDIIKPKLNIMIIGSSNCGKTALIKNIRSIFKNKYCIDTLIIFSGGSYSSVEEIYAYKYFEENFSIAGCESDCEPLNNNKYAELIFISSEYQNKIVLIEKIGNNIIGNEIDYSSPHTFLVVNKNKPLQLCETEIESTYLTKYNDNPYCYNNVRKLSININNGYSMYHFKNDDLHEKLQIRLKELENIILNIMLCMKNTENNDMWIPNDLILLILNKFTFL